MSPSIDGRAQSCGIDEVAAPALAVPCSSPPCGGPGDRSTVVTGREELLSFLVIARTADGA